MITLSKIHTRKFYGWKKRAVGTAIAGSLLFAGGKFAVDSLTGQGLKSEGDNQETIFDNPPLVEPSPTVAETLLPVRKEVYRIKHTQPTTAANPKVNQEAQPLTVQCLPNEFKPIEVTAAGKAARLKLIESWNDNKKENAQTIPAIVVDLAIERGYIKPENRNKIIRKLLDCHKTQIIELIAVAGGGNQNRWIDNEIELAKNVAGIFGMDQQIVLGIVQQARINEKSTDYQASTILLQRLQSEAIRLELQYQSARNFK
jgi:hypothetical protein